MNILRIVGVVTLDKLLTSSINACRPKEETIWEVQGQYVMINMTAVGCL